MTKGQVGIVGRLVLLFALLGLTISRATLVLHEYVGHGLLARLLGAEIVASRLFIFGGGWIRYHRATPFLPVEAIAISLGGVALEVVLGIAGLALGHALRGPARAVGFAFGLVNILHAGFYLTLGIHYGFGDGRGLHHVLGESRWVIVLGLAALTAFLGFPLSRAFVRQASPWTAGLGSGARRTVFTLAQLGGAALFAALFHLALMQAEQQIFVDDTYRSIMQQQSGRDVEAAMADLRRREGGDLSEDELERRRRELEQQHAPFPLRPILITAMGASLLGGAVSAVRASEPLPVTHAAAKRVLVAVGAIAGALTIGLAIFG